MKRNGELTMQAANCWRPTARPAGPLGRHSSRQETLLGGLGQLSDPLHLRSALAAKRRSIPKPIAISDQALLAGRSLRHLEARPGSCEGASARHGLFTVVAPLLPSPSGPAIVLSRVDHRSCPGRNSGVHGSDARTIELECGMHGALRSLGWRAAGKITELRQLQIKFWATALPRPTVVASGIAR